MARRKKEEPDKWEVAIEPVGRNPDTEAEATDDPENMGGMVISLKRGWDVVEFSRVAFVRRASKNPERSFEDQLDSEIASAEAAAAALNRYGGGELQ